MRFSFSVLFMLLVSIVFGQSPNGAAKTNFDSLYLAKKQAAPNTPFPQFTASNQKGVVSNELFKGKVVLINFWFEGCHPCMAEMPMLNQVHQELKGNKDFLFISFTFDNKEAIQRVQEKYGLTFVVLSTSIKECARLNFGSGYPTTIILNKNGTIKYMHNSIYDAINFKNKQGDYYELLKAALVSEVQSLL
jgi:thiol-disulfide isomerase/thioredoxin